MKFKILLEVECITIGPCHISLIRILIIYEIDWKMKKLFEGTKSKTAKL
jgi:hypothetical protein